MTAAQNTIQKDITKNFSAIADLLLVSVNQRLDDLEKNAAKSSNLPVLHVSINQSEPKQLTSIACAALPRMIQEADLRNNIYLFGPAGSGKTTAARQLAESLGLNFGSICLTAGASETWFFGRHTPNGFIEAQFSKMYREGGVFLADELDAADANLLLSINTALDSDYMLNPMSGEIIKKHKDFIFVGAGNTNGKGATHVMTGRNRLDGSFLTRFTKLVVDYDSNLEKSLCSDKGLFEVLTDIRRELKASAQDEFISTRDFIRCSKQLAIGVSLDEIRDSLICDWSESAQEIAREEFDKIEIKAKPVNKHVKGFLMDSSAPAQPATQAQFDDEIPF